jgi:hypothetical protein
LLQAGISKNRNTKTTINPLQTMSARNGKIARLPRPIREELNQRLELLNIPCCGSLT